MSKVLIKYNACWADEFDCEGFAVEYKKVWEDRCKKIEEKFQNNGEVEVYFGTNESFIFDSYNDWIRNFNVEDISEEKANILSDIFGNGRDVFDYGTGSHVVDILSYFQDGEDGEDTDDE